MTITREQLERGEIDFSDIDAPGSPRMPPVHPGDVLQQWIDEDGLTDKEIATGTKVPVEAIRSVLMGEAPVTAVLAMRLSRYLGTSARFWSNLQSAYDLEIAEIAQGEAIAREVTPRAA